MALGIQYTKSVVFITGVRDPDSAALPDLRGTGFIVGAPTTDPVFGFLYVATAAHVVRQLSSTFVRLTTKSGEIEDVPVDRQSWVFHPSEDIAVTPLSAQPQFDISPVPTQRFVGSAELDYEPLAGDDVYFAGLLSQVPAMGERNVPMVRKGSVGALYQDGVPVRLGDDTVIHVRAHLIDCRSYGGFSGSPCFVRFVSGVAKTPRLGLRYPTESTLLLGMVAGHFDLDASVELPDQEDKIKVPVAAGVAVLQPAEMIIETLEDEDLAAIRDAENEKLATRAGEPAPE